MPTWLFTILSVIAGGALTMISAWISDKRLADRERNRRKDDILDRRVIRRDDFQRETLLALQISSQKLLRITGAMHHRDIIASNATGQWQKQQFGDELSNGHLHQMTDTMLLSSRVLDEEVRTLATELRETVAIVILSASESQSDDRMLAAAHTQQALIQRIGQILREMDEAV